MRDYNGTFRPLPHHVDLFAVQTEMARSALLRGFLRKHTDREPDDIGYLAGTAFQSLDRIYDPYCWDAIKGVRTRNGSQPDPDATRAR